MKVILIAGKAQHGKDQSAKFLKEKLEKQNKKVLITHYGDLVKFICEKFFGWDGNKDVKGRTLLQYVGTDVIREIKPNYWVDFIINLLSMFKNEWDYVIIPDTRFPNEIQQWDESWDTISLKIQRINFESNLTPIQKSHPSETALDNYYFDYVIYAENLDELATEINKFMEWLDEMNE